MIRLPSLHPPASTRRLCATRTPACPGAPCCPSSRARSTSRAIPTSDSTSPNTPNRDPSTCISTPCSRGQTLGAGYERLCRYQRLIHETTRVELDIEADRATLRHVMPGGMAAPRQSAEFLLAIWVRGGRLATGTDWAPTEARFGHPAPPDASDHRRFFAAPIRFATGENALVLPAALLDTPCRAADPALLAVLDRYAADRLERAPQTTSFADRARAALLEEFRDGEPRAERLAARLKTSVRTLNRTLAAENLSYRKLLDHLRQELACRHLSDGRVAIAEPPSCSASRSSAPSIGRSNGGPVRRPRSSAPVT